MSESIESGANSSETETEAADDTSMSTKEDTATTKPSIETETDEALTATIRADNLQQVVDQLRTIVGEAIIRVGREGLHVAAVDPANVAMTWIDLDAEAFESVGDGQFPIGLDLVALDDYLDGASGDDIVRLGYKAETGRLNIQHTNVSVDMAAIDPDAIRSEPDLPDVDLSTSFELQGGEFVDACENAKLVSDHVVMEADPDEEVVSVVGEGDTDTVTTAFGNDDLVGASVPEETRGIYSIEYLVGKHGLLSKVPKGEEVEVRYSTEFPVRFGYEFAGGRGEVTCVLAPRITSD
ncbi:DNA polymerase sliding clamp [Halarchaeum salinum]|uniref:DNA polymerase sliding clamp n=1 Tax=Halarchaeum salinum TaxID=489912 RepID=A0AAV3S9B4_9EURY